VAAIFVFRYPQVTFALLFVAYLLYGLVRPWISRRWRREIEEEDEEEAGGGTPDSP
jgi:CDP-diacylglycerol--serine O-phosphatidyltransferase